MKLRNFAKIFETELGQVLVTKTYDPDDDKYGVRVAIATEVLDTAITLGHDDVEVSNKTFDEFTMEQATGLAKSMLDTIENLTREEEPDDEDEYPDFPDEHIR